MKLRCKFRLDSIVRGQNNRQLTLYASKQKEGDNVDWSKYTPSGKLDFTVTNEAAFPQIDAANPGDHFYLDISPVPAE